MKPMAINQAPKERDILLYVPRIGWVRGKWDDDKYAKSQKPYWTNDREVIFGIRRTRSEQPTHWLPLPDSPSTEDKENAN